MTTEPQKPFPEHLRMPPTPVLETPRLILRPPLPADTPVVQRRFPQWEIVRYLHAKVPWPYPADGAAVANRVTDYALIELGWPHLWLSNAEVNLASHRVKEKQGATIVERTPRKYVYGDGVKVTWLLTQSAWLEHRAKRDG